MPELDGLEATRRVRAAERASGGHQVIVAMTAYAMKEDRQRCLDAGMDGYLTKPVQVEELLATLQQLPPAAAAAGRAASAAGPARAVLDVGAALGRLGGDRGLLRELAGLFREQVPAWMADIREGILRQDARRVLRAAHSLKGSAGTFAAGAAAEAAQRLEALGRRGDLGGAPEALAALEAEVERLLPRLAELLSPAGEIDTPPPAG
jgi:HPt (histidine-containing phosphotransfer) domain-containing protein